MISAARLCFGTMVDDARTFGDHARTVTHTQVSWNMCMRRRPRRAEDGV